MSSVALEARSGEILEKELGTGLRTAFDLGLALLDRGEGTAVAAFVHFHPVDIEAPADELPGEMNRMGGQDALERGAAALGAFRSLGAGRALGLDLAAGNTHGESFAERNCRCILPGKLS